MHDVSNVRMTPKRRPPTPLVFSFKSTKIRHGSSQVGVTYGVGGFCAFTTKNSDEMRAAGGTRAIAPSMRDNPSFVFVNDISTTLVEREMEESRDNCEF